MALYQSVLREDAFGLKSVFVGLENFKYIFTDPIYLNSIKVTMVFSFSVAAIAMSTALFLAVMADRAIRGATTYKTFIIWPYAVAPVAAAVLWYFLFNPSVGMISFFLKAIGIEWNFKFPIIFFFSWPDSRPSPSHLSKPPPLTGLLRQNVFGRLRFHCCRRRSFFYSL
jgi:ABC-type sugar transport system permease subunit